MPTKPQVLDPLAPRTFRRGTTVAWSIVVSTMLIGVAILVSVGLSSHGVLAILAPICVASPLIAFALLGVYWPNVVVGADALTVHNAFATSRIPYPAIKGFAETRIGMFIVLHSEDKVPVTAYASGSGSRALGHKKAAQALIDVIEDKMSLTPKDPGDDQMIRTVETVNIVISIATVVLAIGIPWLAVVTN